MKSKKFTRRPKFKNLKFFGVLQNFQFSRKSRSLLFEISGNCGRQNSKKCRNIWISRNSRDENQIFPRKMSTTILDFCRKYILGIWCFQFYKFIGACIRSGNKFIVLYGYKKFFDVLVFCHFKIGSIRLQVDGWILCKANGRNKDWSDQWNGQAYIFHEKCFMVVNLCFIRQMLKKIHLIDP